ncbi:MAG: diguanylate cyclase [Shimia sp.]
MAGDILIVDPVVTSRIAVQVKLAAAFYAVRASNGLAEAEAAITAGDVGAILLSEALLPDGAECALGRLAARCPVVVLTRAARPDKVAGWLAAGADDVVDRGGDTQVLLARLRRVLRRQAAHTAFEAQRSATSALGLAEDAAPFRRPHRVGVIADTPARSEAWAASLSEASSDLFLPLQPGEVMSLGPRMPQAFVMAVSGVSWRQRVDLIGAFRAEDRDGLPIVLVGRGDRPEAVAAALDLGGSDSMTAGFGAQECILRLSRLIAERVQASRLRRSVDAGLEAAVTDPLTGLRNRRYAETCLHALIGASAETAGAGTAVMLLDLDHFKMVNDTHGHGVGDTVLRTFAARLRASVRGADTVARIGGEEFLVLMPDTTAMAARHVANRLRADTMAEPFPLPNGDGLALTLSAGLAHCAPGRATRVEDIMSAADRALYAAKADGRDQVHVARPAA